MRGAMQTVALAACMAFALIPARADAQLPGGHGHAPAPAPSTLRDRPEAPSDSGAPVLVQLDQLETQLKLTPEQRPAWNAYADQILRLADDMTRSRFVARTAPQPTDATAMQQLDQLVNSERNRLTAIEEIAAAGKAFYATLSDDQKAIADRKLVLPIRPLAAGVVLPGRGEAGARGNGAPNP